MGGVDDGSLRRLYKFSINLDRASQSFSSPPPAALVSVLRLDLLRSRAGSGLSTSAGRAWPNPLSMRGAFCAVLDFSGIEVIP